MCKQRSKEAKQEEQKNKENISLKRAFLFISIVFSLTMSFLVLWPILHENVNVREVKVNLIIPQDSLTVGQVLLENDIQINKLIDELDKQSQEITDKYNILLKSQETETDFFRLASCITAFIVALLGFLGYRTIKDIESKAESLAAVKADETAKNYVANHLETEVETQLKDIVGDTTAARLLREQLVKELLQQYITPLENRISNLESAPSIPTLGNIVEDESEECIFTHDDMSKINEITKDEKKEKEGE